MKYTHAIHVVNFDMGVAVIAVGSDMLCTVLSSEVLYLLNFESAIEGFARELTTDLRLIEHGFVATDQLPYSPL